MTSRISVFSESPKEGKGEKKKSDSKDFYCLTQNSWLLENKAGFLVWLDFWDALKHPKTTFIL